MGFEDADNSYDKIVLDTLSRLSLNTPLTDVNPGSIVRTLVEAVSWEVSAAYAKMSAIYDMGFLDTATGDALDRLASLFGIKRADGPEITGQTLFTRDVQVTSDVSIPAGTLLTKIKASNRKQVKYRTSASSVLKTGQQTVTVPIVADLGTDSGSASSSDSLSALQDNELTADDVGNGTDQNIMQLASPLPGIRQAQLLFPTSVRKQRESDDELRARIQGAINKAGGGTEGAIREAVLATGLARNVAFGPAPGAPAPEPGTLLVSVDADMSNPTTAAAIMDAINLSKAAGILIQVQQVAKQKVALQFQVTPTDETADESSLDRVYLHAAQAAQQAIQANEPGQPLLWNRIAANVLKVPGVLDVKGGLSPVQSPSAAGSALLAAAAAGTGASPAESSVLDRLDMQQPAQSAQLTTVKVQGPSNAELNFDVDDSGQLVYRAAGTPSGPEGGATP
ncbi:hypothetical protein ACFPVX_22875 [Cohnella faecalis]|uniref:Baseplate protein J-like domain-containing protein n=1 Tax=Cohnella faecalis TaxID=2315694 RepID=A0A398CJB0_9BACL|nr:hypothetical protein [Cohnella faecalis]RIE02435.1 hypothetical protein D3H35_17170 [Cohnella faecalis]